jgi:pimeloyl-ACP methyl ester carboxylesterase
MDTTHAFDLSAQPVGFHRFTSDVSINFQCNRWAQWIGPHAVSDLQAVATAPTVPAWVGRFAELERAAADAGQTLDAVYYARAAQFFYAPDDSRRPMVRERVVRTLQDTFATQPVDVPYLGSSLPAYDLHPVSEPTGTWVFFGGFDSYIEELFPLLAAVVARGRRVIAFDGPGQGGALEDRGLVMTPEWHLPTAAVLDHFGVEGVTLVGASLGGGLAIRAAAYEPRVSRVVAFDVLPDFLAANLSQLSPRLGGPLVSRLLLRLPGPLLDAIAGARRASPIVEWGIMQGLFVTGASTVAEYLRQLKGYATAPVSPLLTQDVLLLQGHDDHYVPRRQLADQAATLTRARSVTTRRFTSAESASAHVQVGNIGLAFETMLAWEDAVRDNG